jgi:hypothetical protein
MFVLQPLIYECNPQILYDMPGLPVLLQQNYTREQAFRLGDHVELETWHQRHFHSTFNEDGSAKKAHCAPGAVYATSTFSSWQQPSQQGAQQPEQQQAQDDANQDRQEQAPQELPPLLPPPTLLQPSSFCQEVLSVGLVQRVLIDTFKLACPSLHESLFPKQKGVSLSLLQHVSLTFVQMVPPFQPLYTCFNWIECRKRAKQRIECYPLPYIMSTWLAELERIFGLIPATYKDKKRDSRRCHEWTDMCPEILEPALIDLDSNNPLGQRLEAMHKFLLTATMETLYRGSWSAMEPVGGERATDEEIERVFDEFKSPDACLAQLQACCQLLDPVSRQRVDITAAAQGNHLEAFRVLYKDAVKAREKINDIDGRDKALDAFVALIVPLAANQVRRLLNYPELRLSSTGSSHIRRPAFHRVRAGMPAGLPPVEIGRLAAMYCPTSAPDDGGVRRARGCDERTREL